MPKAGLEPACLAAPPPQDGVSANSTTSAILELASMRTLNPSMGAIDCRLGLTLPLLRLFGGRLGGSRILLVLLRGRSGRWSGLGLLRRGAASDHGGAAGP